MKKFWITLSSIIAALILVIVLCYIFLSTILGHVLTSSFGTKTVVERAAVVPKSIKFWHIRVNNPHKMRTPYALKIGKIAVFAPINTYFQEDIVIDSIMLKDITLNIEAIPGTNKTNWDAILNHIGSSENNESKSNRDALVKHLQIDNLTIHVIDGHGKASTHKIKNLTFKNLNTKNGDITKQIAQAILVKIIFDVQNLIKIPLKIGTDSLKNVFQFGGGSGGGVQFRLGPPPKE